MLYEVNVFDKCLLCFGSVNNRQLFTWKQKQLAATCWQKKKQKPPFLTSTRKYGTVSRFPAIWNRLWRRRQLTQLGFVISCLEFGKKKDGFGAEWQSGINSADAALSLTHIFTYLSYLFDLQPESCLFSAALWRRRGHWSAPRGQEVPPAWAEPSGSRQLLSKCIQCGSPSVCPSTPPPPLWNINAVGMNF